MNAGRALAVDLQVAIMLATIVEQYVPADELEELEPAASWVRSVLEARALEDLPHA